MAAEDDDVLAELELVGKEFDKDAEIERIRNEFRSDAYAVLGLRPGVPDSDIKKAYRQKSLLIHPDKTKNPLAPDAFDRLAKAQDELLDEKKRAVLDEYISDARMLAMRDLKLGADDEAVKGVSAEFAEAWKKRVKFVIMDETKRMERKRNAAMREEGRAQRKEEEEIKERKRKREHEDAWEKTRETRIDSWRSFQKGGASGGKKKKKVKTLG
ncbi:DnaJ-domain-containing protein [Lophiostoma macrostomum CBS 122681]|uniref:DnaJ-domain-containing protein n=1 Tax=Lophiostoma macrostomum CBS 122681 TaxID=1314788 RepID=A0A6A6TPK0_9PLEO|nr:DnaJ-domain-containing protein [Lophiostoma macrostomum CBS 122681]